MSTVQRSTTSTPLAAGQRLDQPAFHHRYLAMPPETRAELVAGVVYMPSPLSFDHGDRSRCISGWLFHFQLKTPGVAGADNVTVILGPDAEPQPDAVLFLPRDRGGHAHINPDRYLAGPPELIVEIGRASRALDLGPKKRDYQKAGVREYLFVGIDPDEVRWFVRRRGRFARLRPGPDGVLRSTVFPGLWLDPKTLFNDDLEGLIAVLERGLATAEHAAFVARLAAPP